MTLLELKKTGERILMFASVVSILFVLFAVYGCGARKKDKTHNEESVLVENLEKGFEKSKEQSNIKTDVDIKVNQVTGTVTKTTKIKPLDNTKQATVTDKQGKKIVLNNAEIEETETTTNQNTQSHGKVNTTSDTKKEATKQSEALKKAATKKTADSLNVKRESGGWSVILWLVIGLIVAIWLIWKYGRFPLLEKIKSKMFGI